MVMSATKIMPSTPPTRPAQDMAIGIVRTPIPGEIIKTSKIHDAGYITNIPLHQMDDCLYVRNSVASHFLLRLIILFNRKVA